MVSKPQDFKIASLFGKKGQKTIKEMNNRRLLRNGKTSTPRHQEMSEKKKNGEEEKIKT